MGDVTPDEGVFERKRSDVWQHRVYIPKDVRSYYGNESELPAKSLGTREPKDANRLARQRLADCEREFAEKAGTDHSVGCAFGNGTQRMIEAAPDHHSGRRHRC